MMAKCSFCGTNIERGTGKIYVKKDGKIFNFCSGTCEKHMVKYKRINRKVRWTEAARKEKVAGK